MARGNSVLKAKRITGPSAQTLLCTVVALERCSVRGCTEPTFLTDELSVAGRRHRCKAHSVGNEANPIPDAIRAEMWWVK